MAALVAASLLAAGQVAGRATRDSIFLSHYPASVLPVVMMAAAALSITAALGLSRALARRAPARLVPIALGLNAGAFAAEAALLSVAPSAVAIALYLHVTAMTPVLASGFWSVVSERFDPYTAKRIVMQMASAAALAGVVGGVSAERIGSVFGIDYVLLVLFALAALCAWFVHRVGGPDETTSEPRSAESAPAGGPRLLLANPLLTQMAVFIACAALVESLVEYALMAEASVAFATPQELVRFFAAFYVGCGLMSFVFQASLGERLLRRFGLAAAVAALPLAVGAAGALAFALGKLWTFVLARGAENVLWNSTFRSGFELLYTPIPTRVKRPAKAWVDVMARSGGAIGGASLVLVLLWLVPGLPSTAVVALAVAASGVALIVVRRIHLAYVSQLSDSLLSGRVTLLAEEADDATTARTIELTQTSLDRRDLLEQIRTHHREREAAQARDESPPSAVPSVDGELTRGPAARSTTLASPDPIVQRVTDLCSSDPQRVRRALHARGSGANSLGVRGTAQERRLAAHVIPLLGQPAVARDAQDFLRRVAPRCVGLLVDSLVDRTEPLPVRLSIASILGSKGDRRALEGLWLALDVSDFELRLACGQAAARLVERVPRLAPPKEAVHLRVARELGVDEAAWRAHEKSLEHVGNLLALLHGRKTMTSTLASLESASAALRGTALEFLETVLPPDLRRALFRQIGVAVAPEPKQ